MNFLLDTNVISEIRKKTPNAGVQAWYENVSPQNLYLSVLVIGEVRQGIERLARRDRDRAETLDRWLGELIAAYGDRIAPITVEIAEAWARLNVPNLVPAVDGLLAATALTYDWTLVTRNRKDVDRTGVRLLNPFTTP